MKISDFAVRREPEWVIPRETLAHLSASSLQLLDRCPRAWQERYIKGRRERPGQSLVVGTAFHGASERAFARKIEKGVNAPTHEVVEFYNDVAFPQALERHGGIEEIVWNKGVKPDDLRPVGERMVAAYHGSSGPAQRVEPVSLEHRIDFTVAGVGVPIIGYVDIVQGGGRPIIDLKTSARVEKKPRAGWLFQGRIYMLALKRSVDWHVVTKAKTARTFTGLDAPDLLQQWSAVGDILTEVELQNAAWQINALYKRFGPDDAWPQTGRRYEMFGSTACDWCGFRSDCPTWLA